MPPSYLFIYFSAFLASFFSFAGYLVGFISLGNNKHPAIPKLVTFIASFFIKYMYINVVTACEQCSFLSTLLVARDILQPERHQVQPKTLYADVMMIICVESGQYWLVDVVIMFFYLSFKYKGSNLLKNSHYSWYIILLYKKSLSFAATLWCRPEGI